MAYSYDYFKQDIRKYLLNKFDPSAKVLDVGSGCGTYFNLLGDYFKEIDGVEVFLPNIINYDLRNKYHKVYNVDIKDFKYENYDIIIFGDIIEHLEVKEAQEVLEYAYNHSKEMIVAVPYELEQGIEEDNIYEIHKQPDLTPKNMKERYPMLKEFLKNELYGYYIKEQ